MGSEDIEMMKTVNGYGYGYGYGKGYGKGYGDGGGYGGGYGYGLILGDGEISEYGEPDREEEQLSCTRLLTDKYPEINYYLCQLHVINSK